MANQDNKLLVVAGKHLNILSGQNLPRTRSSIKLNRIIPGSSRLGTVQVKVNSLQVKSTKPKKKRSSSSLAIGRLLNLPRPNVLHSYLSYSEILQYLDFLKIRYNDFVKLHTLGYSYERRPIRAIEIHWNSESNLWAQAKENRVRSAPACATELDEMGMCAPDKGRNTVFIEGGTHAREWITVTVALHCIHQLTEKNGRHRELLRKLRFFIVPVVNPDGYEYSKNTNPRWRKNRRPHIENGYVGTDCNRNFDFHWDPCKSIAKKNTYQGEKPFSEPETKALAQMLHKLAPKLLLFLSLHSYAQCIMYPWGYTKCLPKNTKLLESVAMAARNAIKSYSGRYYRVGSISHITKRTIAGSVVDYAYGVVKIPLALVMELPSHEYGFQPPSEKISPLSNESWCGINEMCKHAYTLKSQICDDREKELPSPFGESRGITDDVGVLRPQSNPISDEFNDETVAREVLIESTSNSNVDSVHLDKSIKPMFNVKKNENSKAGGYYTTLLDSIGGN